MPRYCQHEPCSKRATHNLPTETDGIYCAEHKLVNMINVKNKKCIHPDCLKIPTYNYANQKDAIYCKTHKLDNMIDIKHPHCVANDCTKRPNFNLPNETTGLYCIIHKLENMVDVVHNKCKQSGCSSRPNYNIAGEITPLYCVTHKKPNMVNVTSVTCAFDGCNKQPNFNFVDCNTGLYCISHKLDNMVDVKHTLCHHEGCTIRATFNYASETTGLYCSSHKLQNMVDMYIQSALCRHEGCSRYAIYNYENQPRRFCSQHKASDMIDVHNPRCQTPLCNTVISSDNGYEGYCRRCFMYMFPDRTVARNYKTKERTVTDFVLERFPTITWTRDHRIPDGCSKRRPDLYADFGYQILIVEIDENQHQEYETTCEYKRMVELSEDVFHRPIVFLRFNPDGFSINGETEIKSCWTLDKQGMCVVAKRQTQQWNERLETLANRIQYWTTNETNNLVEIEHLFYDKLF